MRTHVVLMVLVCLGGCTRDNPLAITGDGGTTCSAYTDSKSCAADARCAIAACAQCDGSSLFVACYDATRPPPVRCTPPSCTGSCKGLSEAACKARPDCRADECPTCGGGSYYLQCSDAATPQGPCEGPPCPASCADVTTLDGCDARPDCHAVFMPGACGCANCCCTPFSRCAEGSTVNCKGPASCKSAPPYCNEPACNGAYAVGYANGCYEGCVEVTRCAP